MKKKIFVKGPVLSQSGYGEQSRFALRALRSREDLFDIYVQPIAWGRTGWVWEDSEFRQWMDERILTTQILLQQKQLQPDISLQITIPNEFEKLCPINIGYTAGIETTKVSPAWLQKGNDMDKILVVSQHAKDSYVNTEAVARNQQTGETFPYKLETPVEVVWENTPFETETEEIPGFNPRHDFNFLCVSQFGPRKNLENTIRWFVEEFVDQEVGFVLKTNIKSNCRMDKEAVERTLSNILAVYPERKCSVSLLHGDLSNKQMRALYTHDKIKAMVNISHGEGFGLPLFEAARYALPIIAVGWSGQVDFLSNKYLKVKHTMDNIQQTSVWPGVLEEDSQWAFAEQGSFKMALRMMKKRYKDFEKQAEELQDYVDTHFRDEVLFEKFCNEIIGKSSLKPEPIESISFCIPTNGVKPEKTRLTIKSIQQELGEFPHEIILAGDIENFRDIQGVTLVDKSEEAHSRKVAALRNAAGDSSRYDTIVWCDDDVIIGKDWLHNTLEFSKNNGWSVLGNRVLLPDGGRYWDRATLEPHIMVSYDHPEYDRSLYQSSAFFVSRRRVFENVRWDESKLVYADKEGQIPEDVQYSLDLIKAGFNISFNKDSLVWHYDDSYCEIEEVCLKKELITKNTGIDFFPSYCKDFEGMLE